ncbi:hypothetical protein AYO47_08270 [Planctomyces sp. SCGC AG-212-M04]|nr:hypothetical protein AYO47_08270 [Planctomyces sp. SCGC AG-212-M04]
MLDVLRAAATILVTMNHLRVNQFPPYTETVCNIPGLKAAFFTITRLGIEAVLLFFVLSGYLVGGRAARRAAQGNFDVASYSIDRFTRIYVPLVPALVCALVVGAWDSTPISAYEAIINGLSLQGVVAPPLLANTALWSLSYEVWFYILCGAAAALWGGRSYAQFLLAWGLLFVALLVFIRLDPAYLFVWILGGCAYLIPKGRGTPVFILGTLLMISGIGLTQLTSISHQVDLSSFSQIPRGTAILVLGFGYAVVLGVTARRELHGVIGRVCAKAGAAVAPWSYSLYLIHIPSIVVMRMTGVLKQENVLSAGSLLRFTGNLAILCAVAVIFWRLFEANTPSVRRLMRSWCLATPRGAEAQV